MLKHVTPAHPEARIPDPTRGAMLPAGGAPVHWSAHWAGMERRGDVIVSEVAEPEAAPETAEADLAAVPDADA